jgi:hypothetical protein
MLTTTMSLPLRPSEHGHQRARVGGRDDDRIDVLRDHLLDERDLLAQVALVADAVGDQLVRSVARDLVRPRPLGHGHEEFVGQRLHDQRDARRVRPAVSRRSRTDTLPGGRD